MYRRKTPKANPVQPVEPNNKEEKKEPVIKAVVSSTRGATCQTYCPMINVLRPLDYIQRKKDNYVTFERMIDIILSEGYLNADFDHYTEGVTGLTPTPSWSDIYQETTTYRRSTFVAGDVIFTRDNNKTIALLISTVYSEGAKSDVTSKLKYAPPVGGEIIDDFKKEMLSSFSDCKGNVYMFKAGVKLEDLINHKDSITNIASDLISKNADESYRKLEPTNMSIFKGINPKATSDPQVFTTPVENNGYDPKDTDQYPVVDNNLNQFNLSSGVTVDGWLIYMYDTATTGDNATIVGDVIKTGPIVITTIGKKSLSVDNTMTFPLITSAETQGNFTYTGNVTKFASEPLNSQQYQVNFGDTSAVETLTVFESKIYTFKKFVTN